MTQQLIASIIALFSFCTVSAQNNYPTPKKTANQLFYIQHSNNHNTYVYDYNLENGRLSISKPINEYRIAYTENGARQELTTIQRKLAYGITVLESTPNLLTFRIAATDKVLLYLELKNNSKPMIYVNVNQCKMYLNKMFVQLKDGVFSTSIDVDYILFYGFDSVKGEEIIEKVKIE